MHETWPQTKSALFSFHLCVTANELLSDLVRFVFSLVLCVCVCSIKLYSLYFLVAWNLSSSSFSHWPLCAGLLEHSSSPTPRAHACIYIATIHNSKTASNLFSKLTASNQKAGFEWIRIISILRSPHAYRSACKWNKNMECCARSRVRVRRICNDGCNCIRSHILF